MNSKNAAAAYATKGNIQYPGPNTEVNGPGQLGTGDVALAAVQAINESSFDKIINGGSAAIGNQSVPTFDDGDVVPVSNGETTRYNQRTDY